MSLPRVAVVRGEALNPYELQAYGKLKSVEAFAVGRRKPQHDVNLVPLPVTLLRAVPARLSTQRLRRSTGLAPGALLGLASAVSTAHVLHGAETFIPWTEQLAVLSAQSGRPLVVTCWETIPFLHEDQGMLRDRKHRVKAAVSLFLATSERARTALLEEGVEPGRVRVLRPAIDTDRFRPEARRSVAPGNRVRVLLPGRVIREKGGVDLLRAVHRLPAAVRSRIDVQLVGDGGEVSRLQSAAAALGLGGQLLVSGRSGFADMPGFYRDADVVCVPSLPTPYWEEQFGMVLAEAMSCGRPVITARSGAIPEVVGEAALLFEPYDVDDLSRVLLQVIEDRSSADRVSAAGRQRVQELFSLDRAARELDAVYEEVLSP
jgi:glycosyltransferase involved in cell wall biosynthesis